jgi:multiple sugar transport system substrate-binding protein
VDRRTLLRVGGTAGMAAAGALLACGPRGEQPAGTGSQGPQPAKGPVTLQFVGWDYQPDTVRQNLDYFESQYPNVKIDYRYGQCCADYRKQRITEFLGGVPIDALYMRDEDIAEWAEAEYIRPLDDMPGAGDLKKDEFGFVTEQTHYRGKRYATIYYVGVQVFMYNTKYLEQIGAKPPETYDDWLRIARELKAARIVEYPIWGGPPGGDFTFEYLASGGKMFDADQNPLFGKDPLYQEVVEWHLKSYYDWKIRGATEGVTDALMNGYCSFGWQSFYDLKYFNGLTPNVINDPSKKGIAAGSLRNAMMPTLQKGKTGGVAVVRMYAVTNNTKYPLEAWNLINFLGGKDKQGNYYTAKMWWTNFGLGFGYKSLENDPEIRASIEPWADVKEYFRQANVSSPRPGMQAPWGDQWRTDYSAVMGQVAKQEMPVKEGIAEGVRIWENLRAEWQRTKGNK